MFGQNEHFETIFSQMIAITLLDMHDLEPKANSLLVSYTIMLFASFE